jgi:hypothetical protein
MWVFSYILGNSDTAIACIPVTGGLFIPAYTKCPWLNTILCDKTGKKRPPYGGLKHLNGFIKPFF